MKSKIYIETTIPSYLTAWPSRDPAIAEHQRITREWWEARRLDYDLYISDFVIREVSRGDRVASEGRLEVLKGIPTLPVGVEAERLASELLGKVGLPPRAAVDALHIAVAVVGGMDFLLSWNCTHIANPIFRPAIESACRSLGYPAIVICTPEDLLRAPDHAS